MLRAKGNFIQIMKKNINSDVKKLKWASLLLDGVLLQA